MKRDVIGLIVTFMANKIQTIKSLDPHDRALVVSHTEHGDKIRIISARVMTRQEQKAYEDD